MLFKKLVQNQNLLVVSKPYIVLKSRKGLCKIDVDFGCFSFAFNTNNYQTNNSNTIYFVKLSSKNVFQETNQRTI